MLLTLAYRIPFHHLDSVLGTVTAYPLTADFTEAWKKLPRTRTDRSPRYANLATGLTAATGKPVRLFGAYQLAERETDAGGRALLLTSDSEFDHRLRVAVRAWERNLDGTGPSLLTDVIPPAERQRAFADFIEFRPGTVPDMPGWVFRTAAWQIAQRLAGAPLDVGVGLDEGRALSLRMDTDGSVLAWNAADLVGDGSGYAYSVARIEVRIATRRGVGNLIVCFDAHLSRITRTGAGAKHVWIERASDTPILRLPLLRRYDKENDRWLMKLDSGVTAILEACQLDALEITELPTTPGKIRPHLAKSDFHAVGNGLGARFMLRLHEHVQRTLPMLTPLNYEVDRSIKVFEHVPSTADEGLTADVVLPSGYEHVTIACVYATTRARDRMLVELSKLAGRPIRPSPELPPVPINERLDVVARYCPELLSHETVNRAAHLAVLRAEQKDGHLVVAWLETEYDSEAPPMDNDAKPHLRRLLGHLGVPSQFLATKPVGAGSEESGSKGNKRKSSTCDSEEEHAARAALRDLLRSAGVLDDRLRRTLVDERLKGHRLDRRTAFVGVNVRRQQTGGSAPLLVVTLVAVIADPDSLTSWRTLMYSEERRVWLPVAAAVSDFFTGPIGTAQLGRSDEKGERTRQAIDDRLVELAEGAARGLPMVVFADAVQARTLWTGLCNDPGPALPGERLAASGVDIAVVRLDTDMAGLGRPVTRKGHGRMPLDETKPAAPGQAVYRLSESTEPSWYFAGASRLYKGRYGRGGVEGIRWSYPPGDKERRKPWHAYTAKEIVIARAGSWEPAVLAGLTARLCEQPVSWDGRTRLPVPLHFAQAVDRNHPDHRARDEAEDGRVLTDPAETEAGEDAVAEA